MKQQRLLRMMLLTLLVSMLGFGEASAQRAYALFTESTGELRFKYDSNYLTGQAYQLNTGGEDPAWYTDGTYKKVKKVVFDATFATVRPTSTYRWFYYMENLNEIAGWDVLNTSAVTTMDWMFSHCKLSILENMRLDTKNVTTMRGMFSYCSGTSFCLKIDTRNVTDMSRMFFNCKQLEVLDLSDLNTSKVEDMSSMFRGCGALKTIYVGKDWDSSWASKYDDMFEGCSSIVGGEGTTYNWQGTDKSFAHVDHGGASPGYLTLNNQYAVFGDFSTLTFYDDTNMGVRTGKKYYLNRTGGWEGWYYDGTNKQVKHVMFDASFADARPTEVRRWFQEMENLEGISGIWENLDISEVTDLSYMFYKCSSLKNVDLSHFDTKNVTDMGFMFNGCSSLTTIYVGANWNTAKVTYSANMFTGCTNLVGGQGTTYDERFVDKFYAVPDEGLSSPDPGYLTWGGPYAVIDGNVMTFYCDTERSSRTGEVFSLNSYRYADPEWSDYYRQFVESVVFAPSFAVVRPSTTHRWFYNMYKLTSIQDMSEYLNTNEVDYMRDMFNNCKELKTIDLSGFNTANVTNMYSMFEYCGAPILDLSSFDTHNVQNMSHMFAYCRSLETIYVGDGWQLEGDVDTQYMFLKCNELVGGQGTTFDENHVDGDYAHVDGGPSDPGYLTKAGLLKGDVNLDGQVGIGDIVAITNIMAGIETDPGMVSRADVNGDTQVGIGDIVAITNIMAGMEAQ